MRVAADVGPLELAEYQQAARLVLRHPLITASYPDRTALPLARKWARQLRTDLAEVARLPAGQHRRDDPAAPRAGHPGRHPSGPDPRPAPVRPAPLRLPGADAGGARPFRQPDRAQRTGRRGGRRRGADRRTGLDTGRKADRDAFVDAVAWLEARGALRTGRRVGGRWANDPERAEALYDIDREIAAAVYAPSRVLQHLSSVTDAARPGRTAMARPSRNRCPAQARHARRARRLVLENPVVYYADADTGLAGQLRSAALTEDVERLTGLPRGAPGRGRRAGRTSGQRLATSRFPGDRHGRPGRAAAVRADRRVPAARPAPGSSTFPPPPPPSGSPRRRGASTRLCRPRPGG